ncbi:C-type lectin domain family 4 member E-like [Alligator mississippiensis]|uniref:C-type lectin domain family 4 member E-like n=1 Tax=Alligator mississippiensis TaxID=8496 RepID=A0A151NGS9_ALLMI|nr:C-type lectin domain family 4 member E-like [Alligator mississippiensis]
MASEITYAEVKFKDPLPSEEAKAPKEKSPPQHEPCKPPQWLLWLISGLLLLLCVVLLVVFFVVPHQQNCGEHKALPQNISEWLCAVRIAEEKEWVWTCCPKGWKLFRTNCYYLSHDTARPWDASEKNCMGMGSHLVVVDTEAEQNFLLNWVKGRVSDQKEISNYCLGLNSQEVEGQWRWVDGTLYNKSAAFWMPEEPNLLNSEKCAVMQMGGNRASSEKKTWNNVRCSLWCHGICEAAAMKI